MHYTTLLYCWLHRFFDIFYHHRVSFGGGRLIRYHPVEQRVRTMDVTVQDVYLVRHYRMLVYGEMLMRMWCIVRRYYVRMNLLLLYIVDINCQHGHQVDMNDLLGYPYLHRPKYFYHDCPNHLRPLICYVKYWMTYLTCLIYREKNGRRILRLNNQILKTCVKKRRTRRVAR